MDARGVMAKGREPRVECVKGVKMVVSLMACEGKDEEEERWGSNERTGDLIYTYPSAPRVQGISSPPSTNQV